MAHPTWRYLPGGTVKHALAYADAHAAMCGVGPPLLGDWYGTGSQDEYENLAARPACKKCVARGCRP